MQEMWTQIDIVDDSNDSEDLMQCSDCSELFLEEDMKDIDGELVCETCQDNYVSCGRCEDLVHTDNTCSVGDENWCDSCYADYTFRCGECGNIYSTNERHRVEGCSICERCWENETCLCEDCGESFFYGNLNRDCQCGDCECYNEDEGSRGLRGGYHFYRLDDESKNPLYYGIELETGTFDDDLNYNWSREILDKIPGCLFTKSDRSIYDNGDVVKGVEIVSHPMTYKWMQANKDKWNKVLCLRKKGLRSYATNSCGIHIHLTKSWFSEKHLYKFMKMIYHFPSFTTLISQRRKSQLNSWASIKDTENLRKKARDKHWCKRYTAVNLSNSDTIELRIFRGTLCEQSFWKNLEYVQALIEFTDKVKVKDLWVKNFLWFISYKQKEFPELHRWLKKKNKIK